MRKLLIGRTYWQYESGNPQRLHDREISRMEEYQVLYCLQPVQSAAHGKKKSFEDKFI
jgi:hypothetical protein